MWHTEHDPSTNQPEPIFALVGGIGVDATLTGRLTIVPVAQIDVGVGLTAGVGIGLQADKVRTDQVLSSLAIDLGVDLTLHLSGKVGLIGTKLTVGAQYDHTFQLFHTSIGLGPDAGDFVNFKNQLDVAGRGTVSPRPWQRRILLPRLPAS